MECRTGWVKPPTLSGGLDHIGIQQIPVRIFSTLLPGITVVTDRVANYSFYPWVAWVYHDHREAIGLDFVHFLRRAECLNTLIAERHTLVTRDDERMHVTGLVGRNSLSALVQPGEARPIQFDALAALRSENDGSYFQNKLGGLGQYYLGPLRDLGILQRTGDSVEVAEDIGLPLAKAFDQRVERDPFLATIRRGYASDAELDSLAGFCPCQLSTNLVERELLLDLFLARQGEHPPGDFLRRETLLLLLELARQRPEEATAALDEAFKAACLTGSTDSGEAWKFPASSTAVVNAWASYERNDLLSMAVLGIFWVSLTLLKENQGFAANSGEVGAWVTARARTALGVVASIPIAEAIQNALNELPERAAWLDERHELQMANNVRMAAKDGSTDDCLRASVSVLLALAARHLSKHPYVEAGLPADYLGNYPLNLRAFAIAIEGAWSDLTVSDWVGEVAVSWGIEAHLRVALRKLHHQRKDTFLVRVTDDGLEMPLEKTLPIPGFTASRLNRAVQFAVDLGLATWEVAQGGAGADGDAEEGGGPLRARISDFGRTVLEELRG
jgi:hypothetical protein